MSDNRVDPERPHQDRPFDRADGYSGQGYRREDEAALGRQAIEPGPTRDPRDIPPDNGRRAGADARTGEVRGAGVGVGGGQAGEDFDQDPATGDGYLPTGSEGASKAPGDLGPAPKA